MATIRAGSGSLDSVRFVSLNSGRSAEPQSTPGPTPPVPTPHPYQVLPYSKLEPIMLFVYSISAASVCAMLI